MKTETGNLTVTAHVSKKKSGWQGMVRYQLDTGPIMTYVCRRQRPCVWKVTAQAFRAKVINPPDVEYLQQTGIPTLTGALEEEYQKQVIKG